MGATGIFCWGKGLGVRGHAICYLGASEILMTYKALCVKRDLFDVLEKGQVCRPPGTHLVAPLDIRVS